MMKKHFLSLPAMLLRCTGALAVLVDGDFEYIRYGTGIQIKAESKPWVGRNAFWRVQLSYEDPHFRRSGIRRPQPSSVSSPLTPDTPNDTIIQSSGSR